MTRTVTDRTSTTVAFANLAAAANNVGVTLTTNPTPGNLDGGGNSLIAEKLAEKGVTPGAKVTANGFDFTYPSAQPGTKDNVASGGQTISVTGRGNALAFLGTGTSLSASGSAAVHVFSMTVGNEVVVLPPVPNGQYAITTGGKALQATDQALGQLILAAPSTDANQKWVLTQNDDDLSYQVKNAGSGLCADVPYSSTTSGQGVGQYTCSGTPNQRWVVTNAGGVLTIKAKHSNLSLTAQADGKVVQATGTGAASQRWGAAANQRSAPARSCGPRPPATRSAGPCGFRGGGAARGVLPIPRAALLP